MESKKRSIVKALSYRAWSATVGFIVIFLLTGSAELTIKIGSILEFIKIFSYFIYERIWANIKFGMVHPEGKTLWFTGLSGSGKSTIAEALAKKLKEKGYPVQVLDGDKVRDNINKGLGFSPEDRLRNIFNIAHIAKLLNEAGVIVIVPVISPYKELRDTAREVISRFQGNYMSGYNNNFMGIYVSCSLEECERRDPKGLYKKVRSGEIKNFTGISDPYEVPDDFELTVNTKDSSLDECVKTIISKANL